MSRETGERWPKIRLRTSRGISWSIFNGAAGGEYVVSWKLLEV